MAKSSSPENQDWVNTVLFSELVTPEDEPKYLADQRQLILSAQQQIGFINADFLAPVPETRTEWLTILQFAQEKNLNHYLNSEEFKVLLSHKSYVRSSKRQFLSNFTQKASMLITTTLKPENEANWLEWNKKINKAMRSFPGFIESDIQPSIIEQKANNKTWIVNFQFDSLDNLNNWLNSPEREALIEEGSSFYEESVVSQFPSGFSSWFDVSEKSGTVAPWKMPLIVEMGLYPVVLIQTKFLGFLNIFPLPVVLLINTLCSCILLQYFVIPIIQKMMRFWLYPQKHYRKKINLLGSVMVALYLLFICKVMLSVF
jgi:antibiotic biosynthesis monooxygenase (ABM) superfamily enzyme